MLSVPIVCGRRMFPLSMGSLVSVPRVMCARGGCTQVCTVNGAVAVPPALTARCRSRRRGRCRSTRSDGRSSSPPSPLRMPLPPTSPQPTPSLPARMATPCSSGGCCCRRSRRRSCAWFPRPCRAQRRCRRRRRCVGSWAGLSGSAKPEGAFREQERRTGTTGGKREKRKKKTSRKPL